MHLSEMVGQLPFAYQSVLLTALAGSVFIVLALLLRWDCTSKLGRIERGELNDEPEGAVVVERAQPAKAHAKAKAKKRK